MILTPPSRLQIVPRWPQVRPRWPKIVPRPPQDVPKTMLKRFFSHLLFRLRFGSDLGPTWAPFPTPLGAQNDPQIEPKNVRKSCCRKTASKIAPRRPRTPHRAPQDHPRPPRTPSLGLPRTPSRTPTDAPRGSPKGTRIILSYCFVSIMMTMSLIMTIAMTARRMVIMIALTKMMIQHMANTRLQYHDD